MCFFAGKYNIKAWKSFKEHISKVGGGGMIKNDIDTLSEFYVQM